MTRSKKGACQSFQHEGMCDLFWRVCHCCRSRYPLWQYTHWNCSLKVHVSSLLLVDSWQSDAQLLLSSVDTSSIVIVASLLDLKILRQCPRRRRDAVDCWKKEAHERDIYGHAVYDASDVDDAADKELHRKKLKELHSAICQHRIRINQ